MGEDSTFFNANELGGRLDIDKNEYGELKIDQPEVTKLHITLSQEMLNAIKAGEAVLIESPTSLLEVEIKAEPRHSNR